MAQYNNSVFGISFQDSNLIDVESKFNLEREMDDYDDVTFYLSKNVYNYDYDPDFKFDYRYGIEAYRYEDEDGFTHISQAGAYIKRVKPDFDVRTYNYKKLSDLISAFPKKYETRRDKSSFYYRCK